MNLTSELRLRNNLEEARQIGSWLEDFARSAQLPDSVRGALDLALVEWVTNVISYAYTDESEHWIVIRLKRASGEVCAEVEDDGKEFNPLERPPVDVSVPLEQRSIGGLGIHMVKSVMDSIEYQRVSGRNILTMKKRLA